MYDLATSAGAIGGKVSGAGGGGFLLMYVPRHKQDAVRNALRSYRELPFLLEQDGSKVIFNFRRYPAR
jgi:D-glycero-alpha-D-manno-heptose-7-phosphate kinase